MLLWLTASKSCALFLLTFQPHPEQGSSPWGAPAEPRGGYFTWAFGEVSGSRLLCADNDNFFQTCLFAGRNHGCSSHFRCHPEPCSWFSDPAAQGTTVYSSSPSQSTSAPTPSWGHLCSLGLPFPSRSPPVTVKPS